MTSNFLKGFALLVLALAATPASAAALYSNEMASASGWGFNAFGSAASAGDYAVTFGYDYSADFIPEAPNSQVGDTATSGVKLEANLAGGAASGFTLYPTGQSFSGNYQLRFDVWMNYDADERINGGSAGTTEFIGGGIGYDNASADIGAGAQIIATGDGGSGSDWRAFADGTFLAATEYVAGDRNGFNPHYSNFLPGVSPPAGQFQVDDPAGVAGSPGFQWVTFEVNTNNGLSTVVLEKPNGDRRTVIVIDEPYTSDGNIGLYYADLFSSVTSRPDLTFGLIDNVVVSAIPEPTAGLLLAVAGCLAGLRRRV
ncbi:hypothetical protein Pla123a_15460 [Posidoniimonas polymericola]|uniref:PEP-CTERM protein-sorting domain-containing protein n=1 Tax=Posidoniimonas polymericola TaxID=2528002 RepID=A0A5C5YSL4_9BACT|nr:hypothetical protein [Posidoniimonas polymericola]TWT77750.1 hypothetical protein Pla123a_15460 [Posidoniimonas polymericola]